uniref:NUA/TPR/MLP1-2-like domain-containing protein n=1 Tax=Candidozyma auris TaxID=498019 RepID=A0A0L0NYX6_CANAR
MSDSQEGTDKEHVPVQDVEMNDAGEQQNLPEAQAAEESNARNEAHQDESPKDQTQETTTIEQPQSEAPSSSKESASPEIISFQSETAPDETSKSDIQVEDVSNAAPNLPEVTIDQPTEIEEPEAGKQPQKTQEREEVEAAYIEGEPQDPNTSVTMNPPSSAQNFTTPLKTLPALKDIEPISTPKSFNVAKDPDAAVRSSPVIEQRSTNLAELAEQEDVLDNTANDTFASAVLESNNNDNYSDTQASSKLHSDLESVSSFLGLDLESLGQLPSVVISKLVNKTQQYHGLQSELSFFKLNQEQFSQVQQKKLETLQKKIEKLTETNANITLENEVQYDELVTLKETLTTVRNENTELSDKIYQSELKNRNLENKINEISKSRELEDLRLNEDFDKAMKSNLELSQKLSELNKELSEAVNEKFSFKLESNKAQNELTYTRNQKEWYENELKDLQDRYTNLLKKYDTDTLRDANELSSLSSKTETLSSLKESLQAQLKEAERKLQEQSDKASHLENKFEIQRSKFTKEIADKEELVELLNVQLKEKAGRIQTLEAYGEDLKSSTAESISKLEKEIYDKDDKIALLEEKLRRTEEALDSELHKETELPKLGPSAEMIMQNKPQGISLSALYTEFNHMKKELILAKSQKEKLAAQLQHFVSELESKKPAIASYRNQIQFYEQSLKDMLGKLESIRLDKLDADKETNRLRIRLSNYESEMQSLKQLSKDLGRQLCYYLIHSKVRDGNENPLTTEEKKTIDIILTKSGNKESRAESDTDELITERLVGFASIIELQQKNQELLVAVRLLGKQLEAKEEENEGLESAAVEEAREAILTLQGELDSVNIRLEAVTKERDLIKSLNGSSPAGGSENGTVEVKLLTEANSELKSKIKEHEQNLKTLQSESSEKIKSLMDRLASANASYEEMQTKLSSAKHDAAIVENRFEHVKKLLDISNRELQNTSREVAFWKEQTSKHESILVTKSNEFRDLEKNYAEIKASAESLKAEKEVWGSMQKNLREEIEQLKRDKDQLNSFVSNLQSLFKEREQSSIELSRRLSESIENYHTLQQKLNEKDERIEILASQSEMALKAQNTKLEQVNEISERLAQARQKISDKESLITTLREQLANASKNRVSRSLELNSTSDSGPSNPDYDDLKLELKQAEAQVTEFSNIAKAAEDALVKATESFDSYKASADEKIETAEREKQSLSDEIASQKKEIDSLQKQLHDNQNEFLNAEQELKSKLHEFSLKASSYDDLKNEYQEKFSSLTDDLKSQTEMYDALDKKFQDKFAEVETLNEELVNQKDLNSSLHARVEELTTKLEESAKKMSSKESLVSEEHVKTLEELQQTKAKLNDLQYQFDLTLKQIELSKASASGDDDTTENWKEVLNYLRREKDVADSKANLLKEENQRLEGQIDIINSELVSVRSQLNRLLGTKVQLEETSKEHERLLEQLEQLNILRESNVTLRNENKRAVETIGGLRKEIETLRSSASAAQPTTNATNDETASALEQEVRLLKEENDRLKNRLENNEEVKSLLAKFEALKNEFRTKLINHRDKNRELEKELNELKGIHETTTKQLAELQSQQGSATNVGSLKEQLNKAEAAKAEADKEFETEIHKLKEQHENEKAKLRSQLQSQFDSRLANELLKAKSLNSTNNVSEEAIRERVEKELKAKVEEVTKELTKKFDKDLNAKVERRVQERIAAEGSNQDSEKVRQQLTAQYEARIKQLNDEFEKRLDAERKKIEASVETKYEFKLRVLNRKVEKLEGSEGGTDGADKSANMQGSGRSTPIASGPHGEQTLNVIQPGPRNGAQQGQTQSVTQTQANQGQQKPPFHNQGNTYTRKRTFPPNTGNTYKRSKEDKEEKE